MVLLVITQQEQRATTTINQAVIQQPLPLQQTMAYHKQLLTVILYQHLDSQVILQELLAQDYQVTTNNMVASKMISQIMIS
jgi:hypothetical protein